MYDLLPPPIRNLNAALCDNEDQIIKLLEEIAKRLELPNPSLTSYRTYLQQVVAVAKLAPEIVAESGGLNSAATESQSEGKLKRRITELEHALARKHPHDEQLEQKVRLALQKLDHDDIGFLKWLLDAGKVRRGPLQLAGYRDSIVDSIQQKVGYDLRLVTFEPITPGNGIVEMDRIYEINPSLVSVLREALYV